MAFLYRAYYSVPLMQNSNGLYTNAIFGFNRFIQKMLAHVVPDYVVVVFDTKEPTFRHIAYPEYKANRAKTPVELVEQIAWAKEYVSAFGINCVELPGYEADDIIGTLATGASNKDILTIIATGDKDLYQLVNQKIFVMHLVASNFEILDEQAVYDKFNVRPDQVIDYLILLGDSADNIPGVPGIGSKTAANFLNKYDSLENLLNNLTQISERHKIQIIQAKDKFDITKNLLKICCDVPISCEIETLITKPINTDKLNQLKDYFGFQKSEKMNCNENLQLELF